MAGTLLQALGTGKWQPSSHFRPRRIVEPEQFLFCMVAPGPGVGTQQQLAALGSQLSPPPSSTSNETLRNDSATRRVAEYRRHVTASAVTLLCDKGQLSDAVDALDVLVQQTSKPVPPFLFHRVLKCCVAQRNLGLGRRVHLLIVQAGYESNAFLANNILRMYSSHGRLKEAKDVFAKVAKPDTFSWSAIVAAHAKHGEPKQAVKLYQQMRCSSVKPDCYVFVAALQACARAGDLESGRQVHADVLESGVEPDLFVWNCLLDMYVKCGRLEEDARILFDGLATKDVVSWTIMINGYAEHYQGQEALSLYEIMRAEGVVPADRVTFVCLLKACALLAALPQGKQLHSQILERGLAGDLVLSTCLVDMYAKCGRLEDARDVFDSLARKDLVICNSMITAYVNCGKVEEARMVFDSLPTKDVVTWTAMIDGYAEHGPGQEALALYSRMEQEGLTLANSVTFACLLKACATAAALQQGKQLHAQIVKRGLDGDTVVNTCLVQMYAKCGRLGDARRVLDSLPTRNVVTWNALMSGFGQSGEGHKAIECFLEMLQDGVQADSTTFTNLLVACSHAGLVKEGQQFFRAMVEEHSIRPAIEHCNCMVDLLGRAGYLEDAEQMLLSFESSTIGLMSLLAACRRHGDVERGVRCFENLIRADPESASSYVLMGNIYADAGRWPDVERTERLRKLAGASKKPAVAGIEVDRHVHTFVVGEERGDISSKVRSMNTRLKDEGCHVPHTELVLKQVSEKEKEGDLCGHAEKLALAYGLLNTPDGTTLLVTKNLRMCGDCHSSTEIMSRIEKREIIVRDSHRLHRFVDGSCGCGGRP